jgi:hypothetical protein
MSPPITKIKIRRSERINNRARALMFIINKIASCVSTSRAEAKTQEKVAEFQRKAQDIQNAKGDEEFAKATADLD